MGAGGAGRRDEPGPGPEGLRPVHRGFARGGDDPGDRAGAGPALARLRSLPAARRQGMVAHRLHFIRRDGG